MKQERLIWVFSAVVLLLFLGNIVFGAVLYGMETLFSLFFFALGFLVLTLAFGLPSLLGDRDASFVKQTRRIAVILTLPVAAMVSLLFFFFSNQEMLFLSSAVVGLFGGSVFLYYRS